jgi:N utilization substance protein B
MALINSKTIARLAAVQVMFLYEHKQQLQTFEEILEFVGSYYDDFDIREDFQQIQVKLHKTCFFHLVDLIKEHLLHIDSILNSMLHCDTDPLKMAILRVGACELLYATKIPKKVVVNEFSNIAASFSLNPSVINSVLDKIGKSEGVRNPTATIEVI